MNWITLDSEQQLDEIAGSQQPSVIFKHSTRCPVSSMVKRTFEFGGSQLPEHVPIYFLDLIRYRSLSNEIAERWQVRHESPQVLLIQHNTCRYHASHEDIDVATLLDQLETASGGG